MFERVTISPALIKKELQRMRGSLEKATHLGLLLCVEQRLVQPEQAAATYARDDVLHGLLATAIDTTFNQLCRQLHAPAAFVNSDEQTALAQISQLSRLTHAVEIWGWAWLFYHFYSPLNLNVTTFCQTLGIEERTQRNAQVMALNRLSSQITHLETEARRHDLQRRLRLAMPHSHAPRLVGREDALQRLQRAWDTETRVFYIHGPAGIGKTSLIEHFIHRQIDLGTLQQVIWLSQPPSQSYIVDFLRQSLLQETKHYELKHYFLIYRTCIVLDGLPEALQPEQALKILMQLVDGAFLFLISDQSLSIQADHMRLLLPELDQTAIAELAAQTFGHDVDERAALTQALWKQGGGNPGAARLMLAQPEFTLYQPTISRPAFDELYQHTFDQLENDDQRLWVLFALLPAASADLDSLKPLLSGLNNHSHALQRLIDHQVLQVSRDESPGSLYLSNSGRVFIQTHWEQNAAIWQMAEDWVTMIMRLTVTPLILDILFGILLTGWPPFQDKDQISQVLEKLAAYDHDRRYHAHWVHFAETYPFFHKPGLRLRYAESARALGYYQQAAQILELLRVQAGERGDFHTQAQAIQEMAGLARLQGAYGAAVEQLRLLQTRFRPFMDVAEIERIHLDLAQIAFDRGQVEEARLELEPLSLSVRSLFLQAQLALQSGHTEKVSALLTYLETEAELTMSQRASVAFQWGRFWEAQEAWHDAITAYSNAVILYEQLRDPYRLARTYSNYAAVLLMIRDEYTDDVIINLLETAEQMQRKLSDQVGLTTTQHNLHYLGSKPS